MKNILSVFAFLIVLLTGLPNLVHAQAKQDTIKSRVETIDGNEYIGVILERSADKIRIKTEKLGEISILNKDVKRVTLVSSERYKNGTYWLDNPQSTRYFWSPNGFN